MPSHRGFRVGMPPSCSISLTSLPYLRDNQYIAQAQCSHLFITPLFQRFPAEPPSSAKESCVVATLPEPQPEAPLSAKETHVARTPPSAKESCVVATLPEPQPEAPSPAKETHVARTPPSAKESSSSDGGRTSSPPKDAHGARTPSPATQPAPASNVPTSSLPSATEQHDLQKAARAIPRALKGDWRDVKTLFEFAGIFPLKDTAPGKDP